MALSYPKITKITYQKILREMDLAKFPSLAQNTYLMKVREKLIKKQPLDYSEKQITYFKLINYFIECKKEENKLSLTKLDFSRFDSRPPLDFQKDGIKFLLDNDRAILADDTGIGKAAPLDSKLLTSNGWMLMKDVKVGDFVIGSDGKPTRINGVFPQGKKDIYKITFNDKTSVETCYDHLWSVIGSGDRAKKGGYKTKTLKQIDWELKNTTKRNFIPTIKPVEFNSKEILIDPYLMGLILGDGAIKYHRVGISTIDEEIIEALPKLIPKGQTVKKLDQQDYSIRGATRNRNDLIRYFKHYKLSGCGSATKFIPNEYKYNSIEVRLAVLQGLMDTDGYIAKTGTTLCYYTISERLKNDVAEIVQSLGGLTRECSGIGQYIAKDGLRRFCSKNYCLTINLPDFIPFRLTRKINRIKKRIKYVPRRRIKTIEFSRKCEAQCISVEAVDHLYVMDNYTVTHNSIQSIIAALSLDEDHKILIVTLKSLKYNFENEIKFYTDSYKVIEDVWESGYKFTVIHYEQLKKFGTYIRAEKFECIIVDEAHSFSNPKNGRSKYLAAVVSAKNNNVKKLWLLTGTPMTNRPINYFNLLKLIRHPLGSNWMHYVERYCGGYKDYYERWVVDGASELTDLYEKTKGSVLRRLKEDFLKDLPNKNRTPQFLKLKNTKGYKDAIKEYEEKKLKEMYEGLVEEERLGAYTGEEWEKYLKENFKTGEMTKLILWRQFCALEKIRDGSLIELVENQIDQGNKIVVFTNFTSVIDAVFNHFTEKQCRFLDGRIGDPRERLRLVEEFNENDALKVFALNFQVGGVGFNITSANTVIANDMSWVPGVMLQGEDRVWRMGQKRVVNALYPLYKGTVEEVVFNIVQEKMKNITTAIQGKEEEYFATGKKTHFSDDKESILQAIFAQLKSA